METKDRQDYLNNLMKQCKNNMILSGKYIYKLNTLSFETNTEERNDYLDYKNRFLVYLDMLIHDTIPLCNYIKQCNFFIDDTYKWECTSNIILSQITLSSFLIRIYNKDCITEDDVNEEFKLKAMLMNAIETYRKSKII
jgi:hypothetical protein